MNADLKAVRARNLRTVAILAALFFVPLLLAFLMYYGNGWHPGGRTNHGALILPPRPLPRVSTAYAEKTFTHSWSLVYIGDGVCDDTCRSALFVMRQTRLSLNNDMNRVQRVLLAFGEVRAQEFLEREHAGLIVINATGAAVAPLLHEFPRDDRANTIFIVDPLGNLMERFDIRGDPKGLREDLTKLLKLSHIG